MNNSKSLVKVRNILLKVNIIQKILSSLDTISKEYISSCSNGYNVWVLVERFEGYWIVKFSGRLFGIVQGYEVTWRKRFIRNWVRIIVLSEKYRWDTQYEASLRENLLEPRNDIHKIKYMACSIRVSSKDWVVERLKRQRTTIKWRPRAGMRGLCFPVCRILVLDSI